jgi:hypothetical protein
MWGNYNILHVSIFFAPHNHMFCFFIFWCEITIYSLYLYCFLTFQHRIIITHIQINHLTFQCRIIISSLHLFFYFLMWDNYTTLMSHIFFYNLHLHELFFNFSTWNNYIIPFFFNFSMWNNYIILHTFFFSYNPYPHQHALFQIFFSHKILKP